ncbi:glycerophosphodiester phosphodiesterase [Streptococcus gallolyticus]|nr:glycerophosphodiester phosphodiesterase [Streptococcus gallolyticus]MBY5040887.1 glycerophosphodiester phosphodiesterase [Streptococcus gallolyticus]
MNYILKEFQKVYYQLDKILLLFSVLFGTVELIWVPINSFLAEYLLRLTGYAYLSSTNLGATLTAKWWVTALFGLLILLNLLIAYLEIGVVLTGVLSLLHQEPRTLRQFLADMFSGLQSNLRSLHLSKILFVLCYSVLLFPFLRKILDIYYFNKLVLPQFILDYLANEYLLGGLITAALFFFFWLAVRVMYALPLVYFDQESVRTALLFSWKKTKGSVQWQSLIRLIWIILQAVGFFMFFASVTYGVQVLADFLQEELSAVVALGNYIVLCLVYYGAVAIFLIKFVEMLTRKRMPFYRRAQLRHRLRWIIMVLASLYFGFQGAVSLYFPYNSLPVTISHRGVNLQNGVQNTIPSLEKTAALKPDYIEMDVQETKDGQFVVMHDNDIQNLTGYPGGTHDYSLAEMTAMTASENNMSAPVPSFDEYLKRANELGQKLLVEIKVNSTDSPQMTKNFLKKYSKTMLRYGHRLQSLDYKVIIEAEEYNEKLVTAFILPFNSIYPTTVADGYTMEYSSLDQNFMAKSWLRQKLVYAWTPNDTESMSKTVQLQVDGIITDNLTDLKNLLQDLEQDHDYADLLLYQMESFLYKF